MPLVAALPFHPFYRTIKTLLVASIAGLLLAGCEAKPPVAAKPIPQAAVDLDAADIGRFDALVTPVTIFPNPAQRALYEMHAPISDGASRSYVFELKALPGMVPNRHFQLITITWARAGRFVAGNGAAGIASVGGPGGAIVDAVAQTADKAYDVQVSEAMLLPETVQVPQFDPTATAAMLAQSYDRRSAGR
jgi:hypothetical protein